MAEQLRLANVDQTSTVDLLDGTLKLRARSWKTFSAIPNVTYDNMPYGALPRFQHFQPITETMDLVGDDTDTNLITAINEIEAVLEDTLKFHRNPHEQYSWWLE